MAHVQSPSKPNRFFLLSCLGCLGCLGSLSILGITLFVLLGIGIAQSQKDAEQANAGHGAENNPIEASQTVIFEDFDVTLSNLRFPATTDVMNMSRINDDPIAGTDYLLIWAQIDCKKQGSSRCTTQDFNFYLYDETGNEWKEAPAHTSPRLGGDDAIGGASFSGWIVFEFPSDKQPTKVKITTTSGVKLWQYVPR